MTSHIQLADLTAEQRKIYDLEPRERVLLKGAAGSGKTTVAIHRALFCAQKGDLFENATPRVLVLTYNRNLVDDFIKPMILEETARQELKIVCKSLDAYARSLCKELLDKGFINSIGIGQENKVYELQREMLKEVLSTLKGACGALGVNPVFVAAEDATVAQFLKDEFEWISGNCIAEENDYLTCERRGRGARAFLNGKWYQIRKEAERKRIWKAYESYYKNLGSKHLQTWDQIRLVAAKYANRAHIYTHVVIDEAQDFTPLMMKIALLQIDLSNPNNGVTLVASDRQQIYRRDNSWKSRLEKRFQPLPSIYRLKGNHRNPADIQLFAETFYTRALQGFDEQDDEQSTPPQAMTKMDNIVWIHGNTEQQVKAYLQTHYANAADLTLLLYSEKRAPSKAWCEIWKKTETWRKSKGTENDTIIVYGLTEERFLPGDTIKETDPDCYKANCRLLYVLMTRARKQLILTSWAPHSSLLLKAIEPFRQYLPEIVL